MPDGDEVGEVGAEAAFAVAIEADAAVDGLDAAGRPVKLVEDQEELVLDIRKVGAAGLKLLVNGIGDSDGL